MSAAATRVDSRNGKSPTRGGRAAFGSCRMSAVSKRVRASPPPRVRLSSSRRVRGRSPGTRPRISLLSRERTYTRRALAVISRDGANSACFSIARKIPRFAIDAFVRVGVQSRFRSNAYVHARERVTVCQRPPFRPLFRSEEFRGP